MEKDSKSNGREVKKMVNPQKVGKTKREKLAKEFERASAAGEISFVHVEKIAMRTVGRITARGNLRVNPPEKDGEKH